MLRQNLYEHSDTYFSDARIYEQYKFSESHKPRSYMGPVTDISILIAFGSIGAQRSSCLVPAQSHRTIIPVLFILPFSYCHPSPVTCDTLHFLFLTYISLSICGNAECLCRVNYRDVICSFALYSIYGDSGNRPYKYKDNQWGAEIMLLQQHFMLSLSHMQPLCRCLHFYPQSPRLM